ncbi:hypothetical protein Hypma_001161 [Hypsizygus marmoreus]|uniref:Uncharacterized protein n=1 Tax=Hypsizygus marmoreus TaxID=39966 RepID=A0A369J658_HYPMA|nr:hypothetical protein Hypma_001161 [Hypsizygus marmoreus]
MTRLVHDSRSSTYDVFAAQPAGHTEETFRGVVLGVFNDFLDGDLEVIRTLLKATNDINPSMKLGDNGIDSVLATLEVIRERALSNMPHMHLRTARRAHASPRGAARLLQLSYFDIMGRSRLTIQLTRIMLSLPIALERALREHMTRVPYSAFMHTSFRHLFYHATRVHTHGIAPPNSTRQSLMECLVCMHMEKRKKRHHDRCVMPPPSLSYSPSSSGVTSMVIRVIRPPKIMKGKIQHLERAIILRKNTVHRAVW